MSIERSVTIRRVGTDDKDNWGSLWRDYLKFYRTERPESMFELLWTRLMNDDPHDGSCLVAVDASGIIGIAHYYFQRHGWFENEVVYLQDLYVKDDARGTGAGRLLIEAIYEVADESNAASVFWLTENDNDRARKLYDRIANLTTFIKYQR